MWKAVHEKNALTDSKIDEKQVAWKLKNVLTSKYKYFLEKKFNTLVYKVFSAYFEKKNFKNSKKFAKEIFF